MEAEGRIYIFIKAKDLRKAFLTCGNGVGIEQQN